MISLNSFFFTWKCQIYSPSLFYIYFKPITKYFCCPRGIWKVNNNLWVLKDFLHEVIRIQPFVRFWRRSKTVCFMQPNKDKEYKGEIKKFLFVAPCSLFGRWQKFATLKKTCFNSRFCSPGPASKSNWQPSPVCTSISQPSLPNTYHFILQPTSQQLTWME